MSENYCETADNIIREIATKKAEYEGIYGKPPTELIIGLNEYYYLRRYADDYVVYNIVGLYGGLDALMGMEVHVASERKKFIGVFS